MKTMMRLLTIGVLAATASVAVPASAQTVATGSQTIDFTALPGGTPVSIQFAGVSFSMSGGPSTDKTPATTTYGAYYAGDAGLANSANSNYPTNAYLDAVFTTPVSLLSFTFNNEGDNSNYGAGSSYTAFAANGSTISSGSLANAGSGGFLQAFDVAGSNISKLEFTNGQAGTNNSWIFNIGQLSFTPSVAAVPEPATWAMMILGMGAIGFSMRSAKRRSDEKFDAKIKRITEGAMA